MKKLYVLAGCNGAGKTTVAYFILPEILQCKEFVNADEIAKGLSPFQPDKALYAAGKILLKRIDDFIERGIDFAIETTLSAIYYREIIKKAQENGYYVNLIFFWLNSVDLAKERVRLRVSEGGHFVSDEVVKRRYHKGLDNFFTIFMPLCDNVMLFDNSATTPKLVMNKTKDSEPEIIDNDTVKLIKSSYVRKRTPKAETENS